MRGLRGQVREALGVSAMEVMLAFVIAVPLGAALGVLIAENLTNLVPDLTGRVSLLFLPLPIVGADGAPARVLARPLAP